MKGVIGQRAEGGQRAGRGQRAGGVRYVTGHPTVCVCLFVSELLLNY